MIWKRASGWSAGKGKTLIDCVFFLQDRKYLSLEKSRLKKANLDWIDFKPGEKEAFLYFLFLLGPVVFEQPFLCFEDQKQIQR